MNWNDFGFETTLENSTICLNFGMYGNVIVISSHPFRWRFFHLLQQKNIIGLNFGKYGNGDAHNIWNARLAMARISSEGPRVSKRSSRSRPTSAPVARRTRRTVDSRCFGGVYMASSKPSNLTSGKQERTQNQLQLIAASPPHECRGPCKANRCGTGKKYLQLCNNSRLK